MDLSVPPPAALSPNNPRYAPLVAPHHGQATDCAPTRWVAAAGALPADAVPAGGDNEVDVDHHREAAVFTDAVRGVL